MTDPKYRIELERRTRGVNGVTLKTERYKVEMSGELATPSGSNGPATLYGLEARVNGGRAGNDTPTANLLPRAWTISSDLGYEENGAGDGNGSEPEATAVTGPAGSGTGHGRVTGLLAGHPHDQEIVLVRVDEDTVSLPSRSDHGRAFTDPQGTVWIRIPAARLAAHAPSATAGAGALPGGGAGDAIGPASNGITAVPALNSAAAGTSSAEPSTLSGPNTASSDTVNAHTTASDSVPAAGRPGRRSWFPRSRTAPARGENEEGTGAWKFVTLAGLGLMSIADHIVDIFEDINNGN